MGYLWALHPIQESAEFDSERIQPSRRLGTPDGKALWNALTHAGFWADDGQVRARAGERRYDRANPRVELEVTAVTDPELIDARRADAGMAARKSAA